MMFMSASAGTYFDAGASRSTPPRSTMCMMAIAVMTFVQEKMGKT